MGAGRPALRAWRAVNAPGFHVGVYREHPNRQGLAFRRAVHSSCCPPWRCRSRMSCPVPAAGCRVGDASRLDDLAPLAAVVSCFGLQQMQQPAEVLANWTRALEPGARGAVCVCGWGWGGLNVPHPAEGYVALLVCTNAGLAWPSDSLGSTAMHSNASMGGPPWPGGDAEGSAHANAACPRPYGNVDCRLSLRHSCCRRRRAVRLLLAAGCGGGGRALAAPV